MTKRKAVPGIIDLEPTRSKRADRQGYVYLVYRAPGNREPLYPSELLSSKQKAYGNIASSCRLHGVTGNSPLIRDKTVTPERLIRLDVSGPRYKVIEVKK